MVHRLSSDNVRLGQALDAIWAAGPERVQSALSLRVVEWVQLDLETLHFDTTSLSFYGAYEEDLDDSWAPELAPVFDAQACRYGLHGERNTVTVMVAKRRW